VNFFVVKEAFFSFQDKDQMIIKVEHLFKQLYSYLSGNNEEGK